MLKRAMRVNENESGGPDNTGGWVLSIDTCGPTGSVALGRLSCAGGVEIAGERELAGRSYAATLVDAVGELLAASAIHVAQLEAIVVTHGPGSFTGVRVGLSAVKGLAEPARIPVVAVSRLAVLAHSAGVASAAFDAHRHEIFLRLGERELLAGADELASLDPPAGAIAVSDDPAAELLASAWPAAALRRVAAPTAADALRFATERIRSRAFDDLVLLDGHYLRRSDAEIFGTA